MSTMHQLRVIDALARVLDLVGGDPVDLQADLETTGILSSRPCGQRGLDRLGLLQTGGQRPADQIRATHQPGQRVPLLVSFTNDRDPTIVTERGVDRVGEDPVGCDLLRGFEDILNSGQPFLFGATDAMETNE